MDILIGLFIFALLFAVIGYDWLGLSAVEKEIKELNISDEERLQVMACMESARSADRSTRLYDLSAPLVMLFVLQFVKREANRLPKAFAKWDNNISLNGDSGGVLVDGKWIDYHDVEDWEAVRQCLQVTYDDPRFEGDAYYAKGHHPRSFWARYVWVGLRNRAAKLALDLGKPVDQPIEVVSGTLDISTSNPGHFLLRCGEVYHYKSIQPFKLLGKTFARIRSYGYKLEIALKSPKESDRVAVVAIGWSAKGIAG